MVTPVAWFGPVLRTAVRSVTVCPTVTLVASAAGCLPMGSTRRFAAELESAPALQERFDRMGGGKESAVRG